MNTDRSHQHLDIPNDAIQAFLAIDPDWDSAEQAIEAMHPIVVPVLASEYRRFVDMVASPSARRLLLDEADRVEQLLAGGGES